MQLDKENTEMAAVGIFIFLWLMNENSGQQHVSAYYRQFYILCMFQLL